MSALLLDELYTHPFSRARLRASPFFEDYEALAQLLVARGHPHRQVRHYVRGAEHLGQLIVDGQVALEGLTAKQLRRFAQQHSPACRCPQPRTAGHNFVSAARHFHAVLAARGRIPGTGVGAKAETPLDTLLGQYDAHLQSARGLREATRSRYRREARALLAGLYGRGEVDLSAVTPDQLRRWVSDAMAKHARATARGITASLRSFLRFTASVGLTAPALVHAVPQVCLPRLGRSPQGLTDSQLELLLAACDTSTPEGLRARAVVLCAAILGMRARELAALSLADVRWREGFIALSASKTRREAVLPLTPEVGEALLAYAQRGRPASACRSFFLRHGLGGISGMSGHTITQTVRRALERAGLKLPAMGAHLLRHTAASRLVRAGVPAKAMADFLRHRDLNMVRIYAKVDWPRLSQVAQPWPGAPSNAQETASC
jgi:site-specific recombinase XerD